MALFSDAMCSLSGPRVDSPSDEAARRQSVPRRVFPLTKSQEGMWVDFQAEPLSTKYNLTIEWDLKRSGEGSTTFSLADVLGVIDRATHRYASLRSTVTVIDGKAHLQEFDAESVEPDIRIVHRRSSAVTEDAMKKVLRQPFHLQHDLPARWVVLQDSDNFRVYLTAHHIVADGQAMSLISKEFLDMLNDPEATLPSLPDFSSMHMIEKAWAGSQTYKNDCKVLLSQVDTKNNAPWPKHLAPKSAAGQDYRKIDCWATFPKSDLDEWSQLYKTSWFRVATALVGLLVLDKTRPQHGKDEVLSVGFGSRPKDLMSCIGQFANALPVKVPLWQCLESHGSSNRSFMSLVSAVGKNISAVKKSELFPALEVVRACRSLNIDYQPPRVAVTYSPKLAKAECRMFPVEGDWDLFFCFLEYETDVKLGVIYNPEVFSYAAVRDMRSQFASLTAMSKTEGVTLDDMLPWLPKYPTLPLAPSSALRKSPLKHVHHWFDAQAESSPTSVALASAELSTSLTYHDLYLSTEKKARILIQKGIGRESKVLLSMRRGFPVIEWILATLKAGAAFVYLDPDSSESHKAYITGNCKPDLILDDEATEDLVNKCITLFSDTSRDGDETAIVDAVANAKEGTLDSHLAYIIYTSGSTGEPKGVMVEHGSLATYIRSATDIFECGYGTRVLQSASFSFDASILEWTAALCTGATLCFAQHPKQLVGDYLADVIESNEVTFMQITPTALETLPLTRELPSLRQISVGGEAPSRELFARWHSRVNLVNAYGPTEAAIAVSFNKIDKSDVLPDVLSAGQPTAQTKVYICSEDFSSVLQPQSLGEICLAGPQLARGYCDKPEVTARNFRVHANGTRMYRTGDRGRLTEDGSLLVLGRIDRELKVRGFRIAPEEIEKAIFDANTDVTEASVQVSETGLEMIAFVAPSTVDARALMSALKTRLPGYKVPSRIVLVPRLPQTVSCKTDHKAVKAMRGKLLEAHGRVTRSSRDRDSSSTEESDQDAEEYAGADTHNDEGVIAQIWQDVLGATLPPPSTVNFFDIGGHSLLVPKLHQKLKAAFPSNPIRLIDLFHQSTIQQQAALFGVGKQKYAGKNPSGRSRKAKALSKSRGSKSSSDSGKSTPKSVISGAVTPATSIAPDEMLERQGVAIVGMAGRFPGAKTVDEFYENLLQGRSGIVATNVDKETLPGNIWVKKAGVLQDIEDFDNKFWNLSREEATEMDPQQRLFLEVAYEALVDAGIDVRNDMNTNCGRMGIFVGAANPAYHLYTESVMSDGFLRENRSFVAPSISARTAYHLNIRGPNVTVATNCASSTVALSLAFDAIRLGRCDVALVGGVSVQLYNGGYITSKGQIFSERGECNPFDSRADGTVPADAVVAVVLKRASLAALEDRPIYANILGTGIGSDGASEKAGYQVPSPRGQAEVIKSAWKVANMSPERLKYSEIHGSGTPIGDALELEGLSLAIKEAGGSAVPFTVGSVKGNIGNTQHASGLVSLIKVCKSMQRGVVPATKGLSQPNDMINRSLPLHLAHKETTVQPGDILAVSAAGWGGVNSHAILGFPESRLQKQTTVSVPLDTWSRTKLAAPRITTATRTPRPADPSVVASFVQKASEILGCSVEADSDLKANGLDSLKYKALCRAVAKELDAQPIGAAGLLLPVCSPNALAELLEAQG
ncbi:amino acid adenylation domain protein [Xylariaceae sp. FL0594]|nr:amino acid adenylation domain protein [Xylariaceae sp. FL0594]